MTKYKLAPIEATNEMLEHSGKMNNYEDDTGTEDKDHRDWYGYVTAQCETVEVVDPVAVLLFASEREICTTDVEDLIAALTKNGYKIVKVCNE